MKVSELTGADLDYWVATADGRQNIALTEYVGTRGVQRLCLAGNAGYAPHRSWDQAGPIIERERIDINTTVEGWEAYCDIKQKQQGSTALEAAMRAYVTDRYGEEVPEIN
jgi:hypothetical protein